MRGHHPVHALPQLSIHSPVGDLTVSEHEGKLVALDWGWVCEQAETALLREAANRLDTYFDGHDVTFADLPLSPAGTDYQRRVWAALQAIPRGQTRSYLGIAQLAGGSARSVGQANRVNPLPVLIPCHRVISTTGWGGYSAEGGLATKRYLLDLEGYAGTMAVAR